MRESGADILSPDPERVVGVISRTRLVALSIILALLALHLQLNRSWPQYFRRKPRVVGLPLLGTQHHPLTMHCTVHRRFARDRMAMCRKHHLDDLSGSIGGAPASLHNAHVFQHSNIRVVNQFSCLGQDSILWLLPSLANRRTGIGSSGRD